MFQWQMFKQVYIYVATQTLRDHAKMMAKRTTAAAAGMFEVLVCPS